jgi:exopolysaccharide production protein ExoZ
LPSITEKYRNIQSLRGVSALAVLFYHIGQTELHCWPNSSYYLFYLFALIGNAGVDLFFVISGFVMVIANHKIFGKANEIGKYLFKRFARIYPLFWLVSLPKLYSLLFRDKAPLETCAGFLLIPPYTWKISNVAWTLSYEVYFYILFATTLFFSYRWLPAFLLTWGGAILLADKTMYVERLPSYINIILVPVNVIFIFGAFIAICTKMKLYMPVAPALIGASLVLALAALLKHHGYVDLDNDFHPRLFLLGIPSALILLAAVTAEKQKGLLLPKWLEKLGDASYSIYLTHLLFIEQTRSLTNQFSSNGTRALWIVLMTGGCLALGLIVHHLLEKPILNYIHYLVSTRKTPNIVRTDLHESVSVG